MKTQTQLQMKTQLLSNHNVGKPQDCLLTHQRPSCLLLRQEAVRLFKEDSDKHEIFKFKPLI